MKDDSSPFQRPPAVDFGAAEADAEEFARLKQEMATRDDILALAAHELRNPLHALALHLALARATAQNAAADDVADRIRRAELTLKRYSERVTVLMELLASPGKSYPLTPREVDVAALVGTLADSLDQEARSRHIDLQVVVVDGPASATRRVDPVALEQVVDNLLLNAFKHSRASAVVIRVQSSPGWWSVQVEDNGGGIAPEDQAAIFHKFTVASHSSRGAGTGLGLWIVTRLVQAMGGAITLASEPGNGSIFTIRIPERDDMSKAR